MHISSPERQTKGCLCKSPSDSNMFSGLIRSHLCQCICTPGLLITGLVECKAHWSCRNTLVDRQTLNVCGWNKWMWFVIIIHHTWTNGKILKPTDVSSEVYEWGKGSERCRRRSASGNVTTAALCSFLMHTCHVGPVLLLTIVFFFLVRSRGTRLELFAWVDSIQSQYKESTRLQTFIGFKYLLWLS